MYTFALGAGFGGHLFDSPNFYTDPSAIDYDESPTQGADTGILPRFSFHDSSDGQKRKNCPAPDPCTVHLSNPKSHDQNQDLEAVTDLRHFDGPKQTSELIKDNATANEFTQRPPSRQSDPPSTIDNSEPITENIL